MNYELAKELKDAGFPLSVCDAPDCHYQQLDDFAYFHSPTLSELIDACGEKHYIAKHEPIEVNPKRDETTATAQQSSRVMEYRNFALFGYPGAKWIAGFGLEGQLYDLKGEGTTPEEAVARLYLALKNNA